MISSQPGLQCNPGCGSLFIATKRKEHTAPKRNHTREVLAQIKAGRQRWACRSTPVGYIRYTYS